MAKSPLFLKRLGDLLISFHFSLVNSTFLTITRKLSFLLVKLLFFMVKSRELPDVSWIFEGFSMDFPTFRVQVISLSHDSGDVSDEVDAHVSCARLRVLRCEAAEATLSAEAAVKAASTETWTVPRGWDFGPRGHGIGGKIDCKNPCLMVKNQANGGMIHHLMGGIIQIYPLN